MQLRERFSTLCSEFTNDTHLIKRLWMEIEKRYTGKGRYYHNLQHLENMFSELDKVKDEIENYQIISFSVFYHDVIYDASSKSNEEKSAQFSEKHLRELGFGSEFIERVSDQIMATKFHQESGDNDTNYLVDADLSILGQEPEIYNGYTQKVRKEYSIYPDFLYNPGREKVLNHFLDSESIFKTEYFKEKYEQQARKNIRSEIKYLNFG